MVPSLGCWTSVDPYSDRFLPVYSTHGSLVYAIVRDEEEEDRYHSQLQTVGVSYHMFEGWGCGDRQRWGVKGVLISNSDLDHNCTKRALHWIIIYYLFHIGPGHYSNPAIRHDSPLSLL